jgi:hypothetical protein
MQNIYDDPEFFAGYQAMRAAARGLHETTIRPALADLLPQLRGRRVVDLGCGDGWLSRLAAESGAAAIVGLDPTSNGFIFLAHGLFLDVLGPEGSFTAADAVQVANSMMAPAVAAGYPRALPAKGVTTPRTAACKLVAPTRWDAPARGAATSPRADRRAPRTAACAIARTRPEPGAGRAPSETGWADRSHALPAAPRVPAPAATPGRS